MIATVDALALRALSNCYRIVPETLWAIHLHESFDAPREGDEVQESDVLLFGTMGDEGFDSCHGSATLGQRGVGSVG